MGLIPKQIKTENMVYKSFGFNRILGIIAALTVGMFLGNFIYPKIKWLFIVFCVVVFLILSSRSVTNKNKSFFKGLVNFIKFSVGNKIFYGNNTKEYKTSKEYFNEKKQKKNRKNNNS